MGYLTYEEAHQVGVAIEALRPKFPVIAEALGAVRDLDEPSVGINDAIVLDALLYRAMRVDAKLVAWIFARVFVSRLFGR